VLGPIELAPRESEFYSGTYTVPFDTCAVAVTAVGHGVCSGNTVINTASCPVATTPLLAVTQNCPANPVSPGGLLTYSGTVRNAGNITLTNVVVTDDRNGPRAITTTTFWVDDQLPAGAVPVAEGGDSWDFISSSNPAPFSGAKTHQSGISAGVHQHFFTSATDVLPINAGDILVAYVYLDPLNVPSELMLQWIAGPAICRAYWGANLIGFGTDGTAARRYMGPLPVAGQWVRLEVPASQVGFENRVLTGMAFTLFGGRATWDAAGKSSTAPASPTQVFAVSALAPGETANFTGSYPAPTNCFATTISNATGWSICGVAITNKASATCPILTTPQITITAVCPAIPAVPGGSLTYSGTVRNSGNTTLTNVVVVSDRPAPNTTVFSVPTLALAPGASANFTATYVVPANTCAFTTTFSGSGKDVCTPTAVTNTVATTCVLSTTPGISITETCPPGPVTVGSPVVFGGSVSNTGNLTLTNVFVLSSQPNNNTLVLGPITLAPGGSAPFSGSYIATGGSNPTTNSTIVTNSSSVITTNVTSVITTNSSGSITTNVVSVITTNSSGTITTNPASPTSFGTINTVAQTVVDRFAMGTNFSGLTYAGEDHGYGATELYTMRKATGTSFFDTIIPSTATVTDRFDASNRTFDALAYAAPDVGYGPVIFYYLSHDNAGVSTFGTITPGGAVGVIADRFVVGNNFDALTFTATDVGYGANMFYYVRHDAAGLSTFGTINPALPGTITDRFTIGNNVDALVFTDLIAPGYGPNNFYYLRHAANGVSTLGTIFVTGLTTATVTDRFAVGTNAMELAFTATDLGFGANLFYFLRGAGLSLTTNLVTTFTTNTVITYTTNTVPTFTTNTVTTFVTNTVATYTTNSLVSFTPTNTVRAVGMDICQARTVSAAADCSGPIVTPPSTPVPVVPTMANGTFSLSFLTETGKSYTVQYKNALNDPIWTNLETVVGTGGILTVSDALATQRPTRFYRVLSSP
jgi:uncharacterized repeat protein (TIGR01451 family)